MKEHDETLLTQRTYRRLLSAMSRPGSVQRLPDNAAADGLLAIARTLLDQEVGVAVAGGDADLAERIFDVTRCPGTPIEEADFVIAAGGCVGGALARVRTGTPEYPDTGATVIYGVAVIEALVNGKPYLSLSGPGIAGRAVLSVDGFPVEEAATIAEINRAFPMGIDVILVDKAGKIACIPRSTRIEVMKSWAT